MEAPAPRAPVNERTALAYGLAAVLLWSTVATGFKLGLTLMSPLQLLTLGSALSWCVFALYALRRQAFRLNGRDAALAAALGLLNPTAYYLVLFSAYERLPAHIAQPLNYTWAITLALLAVPVLKQSLSRQAMAGILVSYAGVLLLLSGGARQSGGLDLSGVILALGSTLLWAVYWLLNTRSTAAPAALMFWSFTAAMPILLTACLLGPGLPVLNGASLLYGAWVGCVEMGVTFILWQQALRLTRRAAAMSQLIFLSPFISLVFIFTVLGEQISWQAVAGLLVIVAGISLTRRPG